MCATSSEKSICNKEKQKKSPYIWAQMATPHNSDHHIVSWRQNKYLPPGGKKKEMEIN